MSRHDTHVYGPVEPRHSVANPGMPSPVDASFAGDVSTSSAAPTEMQCSRDSRRGESGRFRPSEARIAELLILVTAASPCRRFANVALGINFARLRSACSSVTCSRRWIRSPRAIIEPGVSSAAPSNAVLAGVGARTSAAATPCERPSSPAVRTHRAPPRRGRDFPVDRVLGRAISPTASAARVPRVYPPQQKSVPKALARVSGPSLFC